MPTTQTLKITLVPLLLLLGVTLVSGCRDGEKDRPVVTGYNEAGRAQKCPGLSGSETCPEETEEVKAFTQKCSVGGREVVRCKDCSMLCSAPPPPEGGGAAL